MNVIAVAGCISAICCSLALVVGMWGLARIVCDYKLDRLRMELKKRE